MNNKRNISKEEKSNIIKCAIAGVVGIGILMFAAESNDEIYGYSSVETSYASTSNNSYRNEISNSTHTKLIVSTKYFVKQRLKAPSTAKFAPSHEIDVARLSDGYMVTGYVHAENSFGAKIKSDFIAMFEPDGETLKSIYIE